MLPGFKSSFDRGEDRLENSPGAHHPESLSQARLVRIRFVARQVDMAVMCVLDHGRWFDVAFKCL